MPTPKKAYCFTLNNYSDEEYESIKKSLDEQCSYYIIGKEIGELGTPHLQGYALFKRAYRFNSIKDRYLPRCHIEVAAGSADSNRRYCSKQGSYVEGGTIPQGGSTRDEIALAFVSSMSRGRHGMVEFAASQPGTWYYSGHNLLRNYYTLQPAIDRPDYRVTWLWGKPGVGKSRRAHCEMDQAFVKEPRTKWWNGYCLEEEVIIDDFGPGGIDINHLLRWFDRYKCYVESKGGMLPLYAFKFIVTSNFHPSQIFKFGDEEHPQLPALMRRISCIEMN